MENRERPTYGGQAVLEGVMIRGQRFFSVAVRRPNGTIALQSKPVNPLFTGRLRRLPLISGVVILIETLILGMRALNYSASVSMEAEGEELTKGAAAGMFAVSLLFAVGVFFLLPVLVSRGLEGVLGSDIVSNLAEGVIRLALFLGYLLLIGRIPDIQRVFMYHGAEHMTVHAHEHGDPLEVGPISKYPTAHPRCGTAFLLVVMVVAVVVFIFIPREPLWWLIASRVVLIPVIAGASYEVIRLGVRHSTNPFVRIITGPSLALQSLTTRQPAPDQIEIAVAAMKNVLEADEGRSSPVDEAPISPADEGLTPPADQGPISPADDPAISVSDNGRASPADEGPISPAD